MKAALLLITAVGAGSCANNDLSMSVLSMEALTSATNCVASAAAGTIGIDRGLLDVSLVTTSGYIAVPLVRNNLNPRGGADSVEFNSIQLIGANVQLNTTAGDSLAVSAGQNTFFYAAAGGRLDPMGMAPMFIEVIPPTVARSLAPMIPAGGLLTVIAVLRPIGQQGGDDQVVGGPISFPVDLCNGCLRSTATCPLPAMTMPVIDPCFVQQDQAGTCCNANGSYVCGQGALATM